MSTTRLLALITVILLAVAPRNAPAQTVVTEGSRLEFLVSSGKLFPIGAQKTAIGRGSMTAAQLSLVLRPSFAITTTLGWARSRDIASTDAPVLDVFMGDIGVEARLTRWATGRRVTLRPFAGIGAGVRAYNHRHLTIDATHNLAAYGSIGGEAGIGRVSLRVEARDYLSGFRSLRGEGERTTRNDIVVLAGLRIRWR